MALGTYLSFEDQKIRVKILTNSAEKWICMGNWALPNGGIYFLKNKKTLDGRSLFSGSGADKLLGKKNQRENSLRGREKIPSQKVQFLRK